MNSQRKRRQMIEQGQLSARFIPSQGRADEMSGSGSLFARDLPLGILPYARSASQGQFGARLKPSGADEAAIVGLLNQSSRRGTDLYRGLQKFLEGTTGVLARFGECAYEVVWDSDAEGEEKAPRLVPLAPGRSVRIPGNYFQHVPAEARQSNGHRGAYIRIPTAKIFRVTLPRRFGGPRKMRRMMRDLSSGSSPTNLPLSVTTGRVSQTGYDYALHQLACDIKTERLTRDWGTISSLFRIKGTTEYFLFARRLAWSLAQCEIREHLVAEVNRLLGELGFESSIELYGLTGSGEIRLAIDRLQRGEIDVASAMKLTQAS